eukprot:gb/GFBE01063505.1/.p1 GENE.gb/GFBE01063505.1/~~gb/GFBE01063505.1/.p1  ORF type:complete len:420 (+),score=108.46 gb/GFBE01063505.1/:1-1260(+)
MGRLRLGICSLAALLALHGADGHVLRKPKKRHVQQHKEEDLKDPWANQCREKLKAAGQWGKGYHWKFAPPLPEKEKRDLRTIWMLDNPHCFKKTPGSGRCVPTPERDFTFDWLLRDLPVKRSSMLKAAGCQLLAPNAAFMYNNGASCTDVELKKLATALKTCETKSVLFHFGDASYSSIKGHQFIQQHDFGYEDWTLVVRTYFNPLFDRYNHVMTVPLGYSSNFWEEAGEEVWKKAAPRDASYAKVPKITARNNTWAFFGSVEKHELSRQKMLTAMKLIDRGLTKSPDPKLDATRPVGMHKLLQKAMFCPAPAGLSSPDTNRFAEAIESGCFPLVDGTMMQNYWERFAGHEKLSPFFKLVKMVNDWQAVPDYIETQLKLGGRQLNHEQQDMLKWWTDYKRMLAKQIATYVRAKVLPKGK